MSVMLVPSGSVKCPPSQVIMPCTCAPYINQISCWNIKPQTNLTQIFVELSRVVGKNNKRIVYDEFKLIDSELIELGSDSGLDFFNGVSFKKILIIKNVKLRRIRPETFRSSFNITTTITISENPVLANDPPNEREIFDLLNSFESMTEIWLTDNNISVIPEKAFFRPQKSLTWLSLIDNNIVSIGSQAFSALTALNYLLLDGNRIDEISDKAFELRDGSNNQLLRLFIRDNDLNDDSFPIGTFERLDRKVLLDLSKNNMTHLKKSVFAPIFRRNGSAIVVRHNPMICDCNFKWLFDRRLLYNSSDPDRHFSVHSVQCNGTKHDSLKMNHMESHHFEHCPHDMDDQCFLDSVSDYDYQLCINSAKSLTPWNQITVIAINLLIFCLLIT